MSMLLTGVGVSGGAPAFVGALDAFTADLAVATSVEKRLLTSYVGPLIRVRRSSDNTETDIGALPSGLRDDASLLAFAGVGSAYVVTLYDQSGNELNATQSTAAVQPRIVNAGTLDTAGMLFSGTQALPIASSASTNFANATSLNVITRQTHATGDGRIFSFGPQVMDGWILSGTDLYFDAPTATARIFYTTSGFVGNEKLVSFERDVTESRVRVDGTVECSGAVSGNITGTALFYIGGDPSLPPTYLGNIKNFCIWKTAATADCAARVAAL